LNFILFFVRLLFVFTLSIISSFIMFFFFKPIFFAESLIFPYSLTPFDICAKIPLAWKYIKLAYIICFIFSSFVIYNSISSIFFKKKTPSSSKINIKKSKKDFSKINLFVGNNAENNIPVYIPEKALYQNVLITGTIGTGKTSSAMYPFCRQLINYKSNNSKEKLGLLILDVKGNFYKEVINFCKEANRINDLIIISLDGSIRYNPLHKPNLKPHIIANRLKEILLLFSPNNTESYWLDIVEQAIAEAIKLCRLYNNGYVTFLEIHNLLTHHKYYLEKFSILRTMFLEGRFSKKQSYDLLSSLKFFESDFYSLDSKILSTLKSEVSRITNIFISDYDIQNTFCPKESDINFKGFEDVIKNGKIVVLNMNIAEYKNLSKIIAAYLKLDFQSEILMQLSKNRNNIRTTSFICDEYHEYVTTTDADFFAQSREAKSINIVATQSYTSLLNSLKNQYSAKVIIQNLVNKLWFRTDDIFTIEEAQKQIGKEDKIKISKSVSENAEKTFYNYFTNSLNSHNSNISESVSSYINSDFIFDSNFFSCKLETFYSLAFLSDGKSILPVQKLKMKPYFRKAITQQKNKYKII